MKTFSRIFILSMVLGTFIFIYQDKLYTAWEILKPKSIPCEKPITYSIGSFDERFGISKKEFLDAINKGESVWEQSIDKKLFEEKLDGSGELKINLVYDIRQEATQKLNDIGISLSNSKASYNELKIKYNSLGNDYKKIKENLESKVLSFKSEREAYEKEVTYLNKTGGASKEDFNRLTNEKNLLNEKLKEINILQQELDKTVTDLNAMVVVLNSMVTSLNIEVKKYNTIGGELGGEFEEGTYKETENTKEINIYQYENKGKLVRVLAHEFGHALGLDHLENPKAVMYRLNNGVNEELTVDDIKALEARCNYIR